MQLTIVSSIIPDKPDFISVRGMMKDEWERIKKEARESELAEKKVVNWWLPNNVRKAIYEEYK